MTDTPERIWCQPEEGFCLWDAGTFCTSEGNGIKYRRDDLPATDEQALANPKVQALVKALEDALEDVTSGEMYPTLHWRENASEAIAAAKETKP